MRETVALLITGLAAKLAFMLQTTLSSFIITIHVSKRSQVKASETGIIYWQRTMAIDCDSLVTSYIIKCRIWWGSETWLPLWGERNIDPWACRLYIIHVTDSIGFRDLPVTAYPSYGEHERRNLQWRIQGAGAEPVQASGPFRPY